MQLDKLESGWGGRIRTCAWRYQKPLPYRLATPQQEERCIALPIQMRSVGLVPAASARAASYSAVIGVVKGSCDRISPLGEFILNLCDGSAVEPVEQQGNSRWQQDQDWHHREGKVDPRECLLREILVGDKSGRFQNEAGQGTA